MFFCRTPQALIAASTSNMYNPGLILVMYADSEVRKIGFMNQFCNYITASTHSITFANVTKQVRTVSAGSSWLRHNDLLGETDSNDRQREAQQRAASPSPVACGAQLSREGILLDSFLRNCSLGECSLVYVCTCDIGDASTTLQVFKLCVWMILMKYLYDKRVVMNELHTLYIRANNSART